jgi:outer membrane receptor protein involved in Fe transport
MKGRRTGTLVAIGVFLVAVEVSAQTSVRCVPPEGSGPGLFDMDLESLLNVKVITASKFSESVSEAPGMISVVSSDELKRFGGTNLQEVLERVPGLSWTTAYFTDRSLVAARGDQTKINGGHLLILINGRPSREILEGGLVSDLLQAFPIAALERIEVIKGPGSVLYGSNAFSAVINLITRKPDRSGWSFQGLPTSSSALASSGQASYRCGELSVLGSGQLQRKADWDVSYRNPFPGPVPGAPIVPAVQQIAIPNRGAGGYLGANYRGLSAMSSFTEFQTSGFVRGTVGESHWKREFADLGYGVHPRKGWDSNLNLTYTRNTFHIAAFPSISRNSSETVLEWANSLKPTQRDQVTLGTLYSYSQGRELYFGAVDPITISNGSRSAGAWYAQMDHRLVKSAKLIGGVQANKIENMDVDVVPRAGVIWNPSKHLDVKALYAGAFRAPSINETHLDHPVLVGNPDLQPEKVATLDLGVAYRGSRVQVGVSYFHSKQTDSLVIFNTGRPRLEYTNIGEATFRGIEFEGKAYLAKDLFLDGSLLHQTNEDDNGRQNITPIANTSVKAGIGYETKRGLLVSLFDRYEGGIPGYASAANPAPQGGHLLNTHLSYRLPTRTPNGTVVSLVVHGDNIGNRQVWLPDWGEITGDTIPALRGRTMYFGVQVASTGSPAAR